MSTCLDINGLHRFERLALPTNLSANMKTIGLIATLALALGSDALAQHFSANRLGLDPSGPDLQQLRDRIEAQREAFVDSLNLSPSQRATLDALQQRRRQLQIDARAEKQQLLERLRAADASASALSQLHDEFLQLKLARLQRKHAVQRELIAFYSSLSADQQAKIKTQLQNLLRRLAERGAADEDLI